MCSGDIKREESTCSANGRAYGFTVMGRMGGGIEVRTDIPVYL